MLADDAVAVGLRPHVALHVRDPRAAHVEVEPAEGAALQPHPPADPVARLEHEHRPARGPPTRGRRRGRTGRRR